MRRALLAATALAVLPAAWEISASGLLAYAADRPFEAAGWLHALSWWPANWWCKVLLTGSAIPPAMGALMIGWVLRLLWSRQPNKNAVGIALPPPVRRGNSDNHGHARFGKPAELQRDFARPANRQGVLIGALGNAANAPMLFDNPAKGPGHCITVAGPDGGKSTSAATRIWTYQGPRVVMDPSNEIGPLMSEALEDAGYAVYTIGTGKAGLNVLDWIDPVSPAVNADIATAVGHIFDEKGVQNKTGGGNSDPTWSIAARDLVTCLLSHMVFSGKAFDLNALRTGLGQSDTEMARCMAHIAENSGSKRARHLANRLRDTNKSEKTWASLMFTVGAATGWLADDAYAGIVSGNDLKTSDILDPKTVVFVDLPLRTLIATPAIGRAVMGSLFNAVLHADGAGLRNRVLFELEEGGILGAMDEILLCYRTGRKYGAIMHYSLLAEDDLKAAWGEERANIIRNCCSWISYNSIQDPVTAKRLSEAMGTHGVLARSTGDNASTNKPWGLHLPSRSRGSVENEHEIKRALCSPDEILRSGPGRMWTLARGRDYIVDCTTAPFYQYPAIAGRMNTSRFNYTQSATQKIFNPVQDEGWL